jgi:hypothetical protein
MSLRSIQSYRKTEKPRGKAATEPPSAQRNRNTTRQSRNRITECPVSVSELYIEAKPLGMDGAKRSQTPRGKAATELPNYLGKAATFLLPLALFPLHKSSRPNSKIELN